MANSLTTQIIVDGERNAVVKIVGMLDASDQAYTVVVDPADYYMPAPLGKFRVDAIDFSVEEGLTVNLYWDASNPEIMATLDESSRSKYRRFAGLQNNVLDPTGAIGLSTEGWVALAVLNFTLTLQLVKQELDDEGAFLLLEDGAFHVWEDGGGHIIRE